LVEPVSAERLAYERDFWSTFGEEGICLFWGVGVESLKQLDPATRGILVGYTNDVGRRSEGERNRLLDEVSGLADDARLPHLCELATGERVEV
jgi:hypothetical protein